MKASSKGRDDTDIKTTSHAAAVNLAVSVGDAKLRASCTDASFFNGPSLNGVGLSLEKPDFFIVNYNVPKKDFQFKFMNTVRVAQKPLNLTYIHNRNDNQTTLVATLVFDLANKVSANYMLGNGNCKLKYSYVHGRWGTFEPCYDVAKKSWDFGLSRKVYGDDVLKAKYQTSNKALKLKWSRNSKFKISASLDLAEGLKMPKFSVKKSWNF